MKKINNMHSNGVEESELIQIHTQSLVTISLRRLSDAEYQKREWLKTDTSQMDCIEDCYYPFTNVCEKIFKHPSMCEYLGATNANSLKKLCDIFKTYVYEISVCVPECCLDFGNVVDILEDSK